MLPRLASAMLLASLAFASSVQGAETSIPGAASGVECLDSALVLTDTLTLRERVVLRGDLVAPSSPECPLPPAVPDFPANGEQRVVLWGQSGGLDTAFHGDVLVRAGATLVVRPGKYRFRSLVMEWDSRLVVDTAGQDESSHIELLVAQGIRWMDRVQNRWPGLSDSAAASRVRVMIGVGTVDIGYDAVVRASIWAPRSRVRIQDRAVVIGQVVASNQYWGWDARGQWVAPRFAPSWLAPSAGVVILAPRESYSSAFSWPVAWTVDGILQDTALIEPLGVEGVQWVRRCHLDRCDSVRVVVDRTAPVVTFLSPNSSRSWTSETTIALRWIVDGVAQEELVSLLEGENLFLRAETDEAGNTGRAQVVVVRDIVAPEVAILEPSDGFVTNRARIGIRWIRDGVEVIDSAFLSDGANAIVRTATDSAGNTGSATVTVNLDREPPVIQFLSPRGGDTVRSVSITLRWSAEGIARSEEIQLQPGWNTINRSSSDAAGNIGRGTIEVFLLLDDEDVPDLVAPPLPKAGIPDLMQRIGFLYSGEDAVQVGAIEDSIRRDRLTQIFGTARTPDGNVLEGVRVAVLGHPEFGHTMSRADGRWDLAVNGGGVVVVDFSKPGYLPIQRSLVSVANKALRVEDVAMTPLSSNALVADVSGGSVAPQTLVAERIQDSSGSRQAVFLLPSGLSARMVAATGDTITATSLTLRATEYTVGPNGPKAMPGTLPADIAYTYAFELSADEALAQGAETILFDRAASFFVENFLDFPVGTIVPTGWYDRAKARWVASENGRVIRVLSIQDGVASVDLNGDGLADDGDGSPSLEVRRELARLYGAGQTLWWTTMTHLTPWDCNWGFGPPEDAEQNKEEHEFDEQDEDCCKESGSVVGIQDASLGEVLPVAGEAWNLNWTSLRAKGRALARTLRLNLSGPTIPASLRSITLMIDVAGQHHEATYPATANLEVEWTWDGKDGWGRELSGVQDASVQIGYNYRGVYQQTPRFGYHGDGVAITGSRTRQEVTLWQQVSLFVSNGMGKDWGIAGWTPSQHHRLDVARMQVHLGDGNVSKGSDVAYVLETVASDLGGWPPGIAFEPDGTFWIAPYSNDQVAHYSADGRTILETVQVPFSHGIAVEPSGGVLVSSIQNALYRINPDRTVTKLTGSAGFCGDGGPADLACVNALWSVAVAWDGTIYVADTRNSRIRRISTDGVISTAAGTGLDGFSGDEIAATTARINQPNGVGVRRNGNLLIADTHNCRIREVLSNGMIRTIAGSGPCGSGGDGGPATLATLNYPTTVTESPAGEICFTELFGAKVRCVDIYGIIRTIAGTGTSGRGTTPGIPTEVAINYPQGIAYDLQGRLTFIDRENHRVLRLTPAMGRNVASNELSIPSKDGSELWIFDGAGRHLRTLDGLYGDTLWLFEYDVEGALVALVDAQGQRTRFERDPDGLSIVSPASRGGLTTRLGMDASGRIARAIAPDSATWNMEWTGDLLTAFVQPDSGRSTFTYDALGRLVRDTDARGGWQELSSRKVDGWKEATRTTAGGHRTTYRTKAASGVVYRETRSPDGGTTSSELRADGSSRMILQDGTRIEETVQADPRWGWAVTRPATRSITSPGGRTSTSSSRFEVVDAESPFRFGSLRESMARDGATWTRVWSPSTREWTFTDPSGRVSRSVLDEHSRVVSTSTPGVQAVTYSYDGLDRVVAVAQGERVTQYQWDDSGRVDTIVDPSGRIHAFRYDPVGRLVSQRLPDGREIGFGRDARGRVSSLTPPGRQAYGFAYDRAGLDTLSWSPSVLGDSARIARGFDLDQKPSWIVLPSGDTLRLEYDAASRPNRFMTSRDTTAYTYDAQGRLGAIQRGGQGLSYAYDGSLPLSETWSGIVTGRVSTAWGQGLRPTSQTVGGSSLPYVFEADGRLARVGAYLVSRDPATGWISSDRTDNVVREVTHSERGEIVSETYRVDDQVVIQAEFERDSLGRVVGRQGIRSGVAVEERFHYDLAGRLDSVWRDGSLQAWWSYDSNGVRIAGTGVGTAVVDAQDRVLSSGGRTYAYDANGRLRERSDATGTTRFEYDEVGGLRSAVLPTGDSVGYVLDPAGRRIARSLNGVVTHRWLWEGSLRPVAEVDSEGEVLTRYVYGLRPNVPEYLVRGDSTYRLVLDERGSVRMVVNAASGSVASSFEYDVWGNVTHSFHPEFQPFGYGGGLRDDATGLVRFGARDYDPELGRWTAKDPIGFNGGLTNLYGYVGNDPVNAVDPNGQIAWVVGGLVIGGTVNIAYQLATNGTIEWSQVGVSALAGAASGGVSSLIGVSSLRIGGMIAANAVANGSISAAATAFQNWIDYKSILCGVGTSFGWGAFTGGASGAVGLSVGKIGSMIREREFARMPLEFRLMAINGAITMHKSVSGWNWAIGGSTLSNFVSNVVSNAPNPL